MQEMAGARTAATRGYDGTMRRIALALVAFLALGAAPARAGPKIAPRPLVLGEVALIAPRHLTAARRAEVVIYAGATVYRFRTSEASRFVIRLLRAGLYYFRVKPTRKPTVTRRR